MILKSLLLRLVFSLDIPSSVLFVILVGTVASTLAVLFLACCVLIEMPDLHELLNQKSCLEIKSDGLGCAYTGHQMESLLDKEISHAHDRFKQEEKENNRKEMTVHLSYIPTVYVEPKPSARYTMETAEDTCGEVDETRMCVLSPWMHIDDVTPSGGFQRYGIQLHNGRATVPVSGTYHIYSFLSLHNPITNHSNTTTSTKHSIHVRGMLDATARPLISNEQSLKPGQNSGNYVNGFVNLRVGDEISVRINDIALIDDAAAQYNYFGVHLI